MKSERIDAVRANNHKRVFEIRVGREKLEMPYAAFQNAPTPEDPLERVFVDPELGNHAFTYFLKSGVEDGAHVWTVRLYNHDPNVLADLRLYDLTLAAQECMKESGIAKRSVMRRLQTSAAQLYRLLDQTNYTKSMKQVVSLIYALGYDVKFDVKKRERVPAPK